MKNPRIQRGGLRCASACVCFAPCLLHATQAVIISALKLMEQYPFPEHMFKVFMLGGMLMSYIRSNQLGRPVTSEGGAPSSSTDSHPTGGHVVSHAVCACVVCACAVAGLMPGRVAGWFGGRQVQAFLGR